MSGPERPDNTFHDFTVVAYGVGDPGDPDTRCEHVQVKALDFAAAKAYVLRAVHWAVSAT